MNEDFSVQRIFVTANVPNGSANPESFAAFAAEDPICTSGLSRIFSLIVH